MNLHVQTTRQGIAFKVYIQPRASGNEIAGRWQDALKIRLTAPPADGKANQALLKFLAKQLGVPKSDLEILSGAASRSKKICVRIAGKDDREQAAARLRERLESLANKKGG